MIRSWMQRFLGSTRFIRRAVWLALAALAVSMLVFGVYYVVDRYSHPPDRSPAELGIEQMQRAIRDDPQNPELRLALIEVYLAAGRNGEALEQAQQVLALYPDNPGALLAAGVASARLDRPEAALEPLIHFVALRKDRPMAGADQALEAAYYFLGESYVKLDRAAEAVPVLEAALAINRTDADALYQLGLAHQAQGELLAAVDCYHRATRLVPDFYEVYEAMIAAYSALGQPQAATYARGMVAFCDTDYRAAERYLRQATAALPDFGPAFLGIGLTYERTGRLDAALAALQHAYNLDHGDLVAQQAIGRIQAALESKK